MAKKTKFHITDDGPKPCEASIKDCPVGGTHYDTEGDGWRAFEASRGSQLPGSVRKNKSFNPFSPEMNEALSKAPLYVKKARVTMRVAKPGEKLETVLQDGTVETTRVLDGGEAIVKNPMGEEYAMAMEKFTSRYAKDGEEWQATGEVRAVKNPTGDNITIMAPWGEEQHGDANCYIACNPSSPDDRYIIGGAEFANTYGEKKESMEELQPFHGAPHPMKGGSYQGVKIAPAQIQGALGRLREHLGDDAYTAYTEAKAQRDGEGEYHVTLVSPQEMRALKKAGRKLPSTPSMEITPQGIGHAEKGENEAWYLVCSSPQVQTWRASMNLPPQDLHVTLAFKGKDVHGVDKGPSTLI